jgi:hypothetical protein
MSMGWMAQVASIPKAPPLTKGLINFQTPVVATAACSCCCFQKLERLVWGEISEET